jgi:hypothetical protein
MDKSIPKVAVARNLTQALMFDALQIIRLSPSPVERYGSLAIVMNTRSALSRESGATLPSSRQALKVAATLAEMLQRIINE